MSTANDPANVEHPSLERIRATREALGDRVRTTPIWRWDSATIHDRVGAAAEVWCKLELWQYAGSFKARGALTVMSELSPDALARGVTAVSAGNHAIATAFAARALGTTAKVVMMENANPLRIARCRALGAEIELMPDVHRAFERTEEIQRDEGRTFVHPFEGPGTALGTATVGLELVDQLGGAPPLDAVVVPIGGGGLCAGVATAIKQAWPTCAVYGVEPVGADSMHRSFAAGEPRPIDGVRTIADSLGAPFALPYSYALCRRFVDELVTVDDDALRNAMRLLFDELSLAVEPACAAATAALLGPLAERVRDRRVGLIFCGSNIDLATWHGFVAGGAAS